jgi:hypothetical protein
MTARFAVNYRGRLFGLTGAYVFKTFNVKDLIATDRKMALKGQGSPG